MSDTPARPLPRVDPARRRGLLQRVVTRVTGTAPGRWVTVNVAWKVDPHLMRLTGGRVGMAWPVRTALLETRGARTGQPRRNAAIYFHDGDRVTVVASKLGAERHPAWFHNLRTDPDVVFGGVPMRAQVVEGEAERHRLWSLADRVYPPYASYRREAAQAGRTIPIVQLERR